MGSENANNNVNDVMAALANALNGKNGKHEGASDQTGSNSTTGEQNKVPGERVFTQDEVSRMMAREKHQGRSAVYRELGIDPDDTSAVQMFKAFIEANKTDEQKRAEQEKHQKDVMSDMSDKLKAAEAKATLMQAGVSADYVDDAVIIALSRVGANENLDIETVAKDLKSKYPVWFGVTNGTDGKDGTEGDGDGASGTHEGDGMGTEEDGDDKTAGKKGTGKAASSGTKTLSKEGISGIGKRLAEARRENTVKSSFWK